MELALIVGNVDLFSVLIDFVSEQEKEKYKLLIKHVNTQSQNVLMMIVAMNSLEGN